MRRLGSWTVIFRGNYFRNIKDAGVFIWRCVVAFFRFNWQIVRYSLRVILFIVGINWFEVERYIQRKVRIYIT